MKKKVYLGDTKQLSSVVPLLLHGCVQVLSGHRICVYFPLQHSIFRLILNLYNKVKQLINMMLISHDLDYLILSNFSTLLQQTNKVLWHNTQLYLFEARILFHQHCFCLYFYESSKTVIIIFAMYNSTWCAINCINHIKLPLLSNKSLLV